MKTPGHLGRAGSLARRGARLTAGVALLALVLVACGGGDETPAPEPAPETPEADDPGEDADAAPDDVERWEPDRPITVVIGHGAGGGTDAVARASAEAVAEVTGWTFRYENREGSNGAVALDYALTQPADGYTWLHTGSYHRHVRPAGTGDSVPWLDWHHYQLSTTTASLSVAADSEFESLEDVIAAAEADPGAVRMGNSGFGGSWHGAATLFESAAGVEFNHIPYDGGAPAALAVQQGEIDVVASGLHEQVEGLRSGALRNLAVFTAEPLSVDGLDAPLTPITDWFPELAESTPTVGAMGVLAVHRDTPEHILATIEEVLDESFAAMADGRAEQSRQIYDERIILPILVTGDLADRTAARLESIHLWSHVELGIAEVDPETLENAPPRPEDFESWWPPEDYTPSPLGEGISKAGWGAWGG